MDLEGVERGFAAILIGSSPDIGEMPKRRDWPAIASLVAKLEPMWDNSYAAFGRKTACPAAPFFLPSMLMRSKSKPVTAPVRKDPWHAVGVLPGTPACVSATALRGRRFLADEAPRLPIAGCTYAAVCKCTYRHYADRRSTLRRAADRGMAGHFNGTERRSRPSRRADDAQS